MGGGSEIPSTEKKTSMAGKVTALDTRDELKIGAGHGDDHDSSRKDFTVLVTGFGPFPGNQINTSHLLTQHLPSSLAPTSPFNPTSLPIHILNPTSLPGKYVRTEYAYIRSFIRQLWDKYTLPSSHLPSPSTIATTTSSPKEKEVDIILHLGMADPWTFYSVEERAFNENFTSTWCHNPKNENEGYYLFPDDVGQTVRDITPEEGKGIWDESPLGLEANFNVGEVVSDVMGVVNDLGEDGIGGKKREVEVKTHFEAGSYCCGFIYYESLAMCRQRRARQKVVFCHVPGWKDEERLERGAEVICAVIGAVCKQIQEGR